MKNTTFRYKDGRMRKIMVTDAMFGKDLFVEELARVERSGWTTVGTKPLRPILETPERRLFVFDEELWFAIDEVEYVEE